MMHMSDDRSDNRRAGTQRLIFDEQTILYRSSKINSYADIFFFSNF
jgi:hypothetical protein